MKAQRILMVALSVMGLLVMIGSAQAADTITLAWCANDPAPEAYRLFTRGVGESYNYDDPAYVGSENRATIQFDKGKTLFFVVRAYTDGDRSGDSNEVVWTPPAQFCVNIRNDSGQVPDEITAGTYHLPDLGLVAVISKPAQYSLGGKDRDTGQDIIHPQGTRWYNAAKGVTQEYVDNCLADKTCRYCERCGIK